VLLTLIRNLLSEAILGVSDAIPGYGMWEYLEGGSGLILSEYVDVLAMWVV